MSVYATIRMRHYFVIRLFKVPMKRISPLFVTGKYANLRICINILLKKTQSIRKSLFQSLVRPRFKRQFYKWPETSSDVNTFYKRQQTLSDRFRWTTRDLTRREIARYGLDQSKFHFRFTLRRRLCWFYTSSQRRRCVGLFYPGKRYSRFVWITCLWVQILLWILTSVKF